MLGLANAESPRAVDVCYLANQNMFPSSTVLDSFPAVEYFLQWPQAVKVELRARLLNSVYIRLVTTPTAVFPFPKLLTRPTRSSDFIKTIPLEPYSTISHVECKISVLTCDIDYTLSQSVRRSSTMGSIPDG